MNDDTPASRDSWIRQQQDEARALGRQQAAAGTGHGPVSGPGPYGDHGVNIVVEAAVRDERARCAALARQWSQASAKAGDDAAARALESFAGALSGDGRGPSDDALQAAGGALPRGDA